VSTSPALVDFVDVMPFVIHRTFLLVGQYAVGFSNVLELGLGLLHLLLGSLAVLIRVPLDSLLSIRFLDIGLARPLV